MADVLLVCVREDVVFAQGLADALDARGLSVGDNRAMESGGVGLVVISRAALKSPTFVDAAESVLNTCDCVIVCRDMSLPPEATGDVAVFETWDGDSDVADDALAEVERLHALQLLIDAPGAQPALIASAPEPVMEAIAAQETPAYWSELDHPGGVYAAYFAGQPQQASLTLKTPRSTWRPPRGRGPARAVRASPTIRRVRPLAALAAMVAGLALMFNFAPSATAHDETLSSFAIEAADAEAAPIEPITFEAPPEAPRRGVEPPSAADLGLDRATPQRVRAELVRPPAPAPVEAATQSDLSPREFFSVVS